MSKQEYPWYIPNPDADVKPPHDQVLVKNADEHNRRNAEHFAKVQAEKKRQADPDRATTEEVLRERERCARVAESMQRGSKLGEQIAHAIRASMTPGQTVKLAPKDEPKPEQEPKVEIIPELTSTIANS